ncbi:porin [Vibrio olivae]|uniref:Porin n=1 Tax=Vibrio olivae TaxID=1243002 RepID=A0ABV5HL01_9VIBR
MKKTLLAMVVAATAAGSVNAAELLKTDAASVDFYGQLREAIYASDNDDTGPSVDNGSSRAGISASYEISEGLDLVGKVEFYVRGDMSTRKHYIGVSSDTYGSVVFGKNSPLADDIYGAEYSYEFGSADKFLYNTALNNDTFWQENMIKYELVKDAYWVKASYNLPEKSKDKETGVVSQTAYEMYELFAGTSFGDLSVHTGGIIMNDSTGTSSTKYTTYEFTAEYALGDSTLGATYAYNKEEEGSADTDSNAFNLGAMVPVADKTTVYGGVQFLDEEADNSDQTKGYAGVEYKFASWGRTYVEYGYSKKDGSDAENNMAIGARVYW